MTDLKGKYFPVLDHGFVALVDYMGNDAAVVQAARSSYGHGTKTPSDDRNLIRMLFRKHHTTPFEMVELKFHVRLPIFVARQLIRHRTASVNEYSLRYSIAPLQFYMPEYEVFQAQSSTNKQGRTEQLPLEVYNLLSQAWSEMRGTASKAYEQAIMDNVARELARIDLPLSLYTEWYWKIDLKNLLGFLTLRADPHAQWEIQEFARVKCGIVKWLCPIVFEAWQDYAEGAVTLSRMERNLLLDIISMVHHDGGTLEQQLNNSYGYVHNHGGIDEVCGRFGITKREFQEFLVKCQAPGEPKAYELVLDDAKTPEYFAERAKAFVPKCEKGPE